MSYLIAVFVYFSVLTCIAAYKSRQVNTEADFSVAGQSLAPWILLCTMLCVSIGAPLTWADQSGIITLAAERKWAYVARAICQG